MIVPYVKIIKTANVLFRDVVIKLGPVDCPNNQLSFSNLSINSVYNKYQEIIFLVDHINSQISSVELKNSEALTALHNRESFREAKAFCM